MQPVQQTHSPLWAELLEELTDRIDRVKIVGVAPLIWTKDCLTIAQEMLKRLTDYIQEYTFADKAEEAIFYRQIKPAFYSKALTYRKIYSIELNYPVGDIQTKEAYLTHEQLLLKEFYEENEMLYQYLRSDSTYLDGKLFVRPVAEAIHVLTFHISELFTPPPYPVCYDYLIARIQANDLIASYLEGRIWDLQNPSAEKITPVKPLIWTDPKTGLIELAYSLYKKGAFNHGKIELKEIIRVLEWAFSVDLKNYPRTFQEILFRKTGYTTYIGSLSDCLILYINAIEQKNDR